MSFAGAAAAAVVVVVVIAVVSVVCINLNAARQVFHLWAMGCEFRVLWDGCLLHCPHGRKPGEGAGMFGLVRLLHLLCFRQSIIHDFSGSRILSLFLAFFYSSTHVLCLSSILSLSLCLPPSCSLLIYPSACSLVRPRDVCKADRENVADFQLRKLPLGMHRLGLVP